MIVLSLEDQEICESLLITIRSDVQVERNFRTANPLQGRHWLKKYNKTASVLQQTLHESEQMEQT